MSLKISFTWKFFSAGLPEGPHKESPPAWCIRLHLYISGQKSNLSSQTNVWAILQDVYASWGKRSWGRNTFKNQLQESPVWGPGNPPNENTPFPSEVLPASRSAFPRASPQMSAEKWKARFLVSLWDQSESGWVRIHFSSITVATGTGYCAGRTCPIRGVPILLP